MTTISLRFGPLELAGFKVKRSGLRWLRPDGYECRAGEPVAYCSLGFAAEPGPTPPDHPFRTEKRELQVAFAPRIRGRLRIEPTASRGGFMDVHTQTRWRAEESFAQIEATDEAIEQAAGRQEESLLVMLAGRRMADMAESWWGLHTGWYERSRAWWGEGEDDAFGTLLGLGICEQTGILRGARGAFLDVVSALAGPCQIVLAQDEPLVPCAPVLTDQLLRTAEQSDAIAEDMARSVLQLPGSPTPADWFFMGGLSSALQRRPLSESYPVLTRRGLLQTQADAILLSLSGESTHIFRHKRLGYVLNLYPFRIREAPPRMRAWLRANFDVESRNVEEVQRDYRQFLTAYRERSNGAVLVMNSVSSVEFEDIVSYAGFDAPLSNSVGTMRSKEMNLMLHDLTREHDVSIVDVDAIAADLGARWTAPDGFHQAGPMQAAVRAEILHILRERQIPGFTRPRVR